MIKNAIPIIVTILITLFLVTYGNKNEIEIREEFTEKYGEKYSLGRNYLRIEEIGNHQYVVFTYGDAGGVTHHEGCPNH